MSPMDRRTFIKTSAMSAAVTAASSLPGPGARAASPGSGPGPDGLTWDKAPCRFCGTGCHVQVGVKGGRVVAVAGDRQAEVNRGLLCVKGYHVGMALYGRDRLTRPLLRKDGELVPISWAEAVEVVADRIKAAPDRFAIYGSGQWTIPEGYVCNKLIKGGLSNNHIDPNARLCMASAVTGFISTYGVDEPAGVYEDLDEADVVIMWGNNPAEMHPILFSRVIDRRSNGEDVTLVDIGTRRTRTTPHCQHYLEFKPGTDVVIALGVAHLMLERGTWDRDFVGKHCNFQGESDPPSLFGKQIPFDEYAALLKPWTPAKVEEVSGVPIKDIELLADLFGNRELRITSLWCMGMNQHTQGTAINNLVHALHLLSGHFGRPGDAPTSLTGQPSACGTAREVGTLAHLLPGGRLVAKEPHRKSAEELWNLPPGRLNGTPGYHTVKMWEKFCTPTAEGGDISTIWVQVTNPGQSLPNLHKLFNAKKGLEDKFLIVSDVYPTATTDLADLVLPSSLWVEKNGMFGNSERRTQQWFKMVDPPGEARDDVWQVLAVARRLFDLGVEGLRDKDGGFLLAVRDADGDEVPAWEWSHFYDVNVDRYLYEEYRPFSRLKHKDLAPYDVLVGARGLRWPVVEKNGTWTETRWRFAKGDPYVGEGKDFDFYHSRTHDGRALIWHRDYVPYPEAPDADYPFWLCTGRVLEHWHTGTMTMRVPQLRRAMPNAYVEVNPGDAIRLGVGNGDHVRVRTRRGALELPAWVGGRGTPPPGSLFIPFFDERLLVNELTLDATDPYSKEPDYKKCAATLEPLGHGGQR